jgi:hypothetical protein
MKATILIFLFTFLLCPSNAFANGGLPIIFLLNSYAFIIGAIFVLLIEYRYLQKTLVNVNKRQLFKAVASINIVSTLAGIIIVPIVLIFFKLEPIFYLITESTSDSKMSTIWLLSITFDLILAYALTVVIEYRLLKKYSFVKEQFENKVILHHVIKFNIASYTFLVLLVGGTIWLMYVLQ